MSGSVCGPQFSPIVQPSDHIHRPPSASIICNLTAFFFAPIISCSYAPNTLPSNQHTSQYHVAIPIDSHPALLQLQATSPPLPTPQQPSESPLYPPPATARTQWLLRVGCSKSTYFWSFSTSCNASISFGMSALSTSTSPPLSSRIVMSPSS